MKLPKSITNSFERWSQEKTQIDALLIDRTDFECMRILSYLLGEMEKRNIEIIDDENNEYRLKSVIYDRVKDDFRFITKERGKKC